MRRPKPAWARQLYPTVYVIPLVSAVELNSDIIGIFQDVNICHQVAWVALRVLIVLEEKCCTGSAASIRISYFNSHGAIEKICTSIKHLKMSHRKPLPKLVEIRIPLFYSRISAMS